jgi:hypothetical protein
VPPIVGHLYFESSGQVDAWSDQGIADGVLLDADRLTSPPVGQAYYAWLLPDQGNSERPVVLLGRLDVKERTAQLEYRDPEHRNLLAITSQLLITAQDAAQTPSFPALESSTWRYVASIAQRRAPGTPYSLLDHLRHLLSADPHSKHAASLAGCPSGSIATRRRSWNGPSVREATGTPPGLPTVAS